ncbi:MAG: isochorismatase family cysteine hydrolase [Polyangiaceae bacterium]|jgi:nicotinamidase-related amidase
MTLVLDPRTTALLVMDMQSGIVDMVPDDKEALLTRTAKLLDAARKASVRVVYVVVGFRAGYPEVSPRNASFAPIRESGRFAAGSAGTEIHPALAPRAEEVVVTKHRVSAFAGTDLDMILRANGIETLVLAGIATSGVILSTTRQAADADYRLVIVEDACADRDAEVHRVLLEKVLARQATMAKVADVAGALGGA